MTLCSSVKDFQTIKALCNDMHAPLKGQFFYKNKMVQKYYNKWQGDGCISKCEVRTKIPLKANTIAAIFIFNLIKTTFSIHNALFAPHKAVKERHFSLPATPVKQPATQLGHEVNHWVERGFPFPHNSSHKT